MQEIEVTTTPIDLGSELDLPETGNSVAVVRVQNRGPSTVYRTRSQNALDPAAVRGYRHGQGSAENTPIPTDDVDNGGPTWVWTAEGTATLVVENGVF